MSSFTSSSETSPVVKGDTRPIDNRPYAAAEWWWAKRLCALSPLMAIIAIPIIDHYLLHLMYLKPVESTWNVVSALRSKPAIALSVALAALPWLWLVGIKADTWLQKSRFPWAVLFAMVGLVACGLLVENSRARWFFVEWAKVRTANPSFARNTLFWEQRNFAQTNSPEAVTKIGLVGSSQTNQGFNLELLQTDCPKYGFEKNCLAGFGPMQYPFLCQRIDERGFETIVCQLSEFDFYREDVVPLERLRFAATLDGTRQIAATLTPIQKWENRAALADLTFASVVPLWRLRDHFRRTLLGYWWNRSLPAPRDAPTEEKIAPIRLADAPALEDATKFLIQNIGHKELVEANFDSFAAFAKHQRDRNVRLIVVEGQVHPTARRAYDAGGLQEAARARLTEMAARYSFDYFGSHQMPTFTEVDFADAYHLNKQGQIKISAFLAEQLNGLTTDH